MTMMIRAIVLTMSLVGDCLAASTPDHVTPLGVRVFTEPECAPSPEQLDRWERHLTECWGDAARVADSIDGAYLYVQCATPTELGVAGMTWPIERISVVSALDQNGDRPLPRLAGLVAHELGHLVYYDQTGIYVPTPTKEAHHLHYEAVEKMESCAAAKEATREATSNP